MPAKNFEQPVIQFQTINQSGNILFYPIVEVSLIPSQGQPVRLPLLFDTGADYTTLMKDFYPLLGLHSWNQGRAVGTNTAGGHVTAYEYTATLDVLGKNITCPIHLMDVRFPPLFVGLLGRNTVFNQFGFGFWESTRELYVTNNP